MYVSVCGHVGKNVCLTVDGVSVHIFVCSYTVWCMFLSVCLSTSSNIICICVRPSVYRPSACMHIFVILFLTLLVCKFSFRSFVRPNVRPSCRLPSEWECTHVSLLSINISVKYLISNFLLLRNFSFLTSNF